MKRFRDDSIKLFKVARGSIASGILLYHDLLKSNEHRAYSYIGLTDFFSRKSLNLFTLNFDFSRFD